MDHAPLHFCEPTLLRKIHRPDVQINVNLKTVKATWKKLREKVETAHTNSTFPYLLLNLLGEFKRAGGLFLVMPCPLRGLFRTIGFRLGQLVTEGPECSSETVIPPIGVRAISPT